VKVHTGLGEVDPAAYLRQADEILSKKNVTARGQTHPETFIRARAIALFHERGEQADEEIARMVQGERSMDSLDLLDQRAVTETTRALLSGLLEPEWFRSDAVLGHARAFFPEAADLPRGELDPRTFHASVQEYLAYVLLDFAVVDESLGEGALAHVLQYAESLGLAETFERVARDELKLTTRALEDARKNAKNVVERASRQHEAEA
jgi:hypothetical protein